MVNPPLPAFTFHDYPGTVDSQGEDLGPVIDPIQIHPSSISPAAHTVVNSVSSSQPVGGVEYIQPTDTTLWERGLSSLRSTALTNGLPLDRTVSDNTASTSPFENNAPIAGLLDNFLASTNQTGDHSLNHPASLAHGVTAEPFAPIPLTPFEFARLYPYPAHTALPDARSASSISRSSSSSATNYSSGFYVNTPATFYGETAGFSTLHAPDVYPILTGHPSPLDTGSSSSMSRPQSTFSTGDPGFYNNDALAMYGASAGFSALDIFGVYPPCAAHPTLSDESSSSSMSRSTSTSSTGHPEVFYNNVTPAVYGQIAGFSAHEAFGVYPTYPAHPAVWDGVSSYTTPVAPSVPVTGHPGDFYNHAAAAAYGGTSGSTDLAPTATSPSFVYGQYNGSAFNNGYFAPDPTSSFPAQVGPAAPVPYSDMSASSFPAYHAAGHGLNNAVMDPPAPLGTVVPPGHPGGFTFTFDAGQLAHSGNNMTFNNFFVAPSATAGPSNTHNDQLETLPPTTAPGTSRFYAGPSGPSTAVSSTGTKRSADEGEPSNPVKKPKQEFSAPIRCNECALNFKTWTLLDRHMTETKAHAGPRYKCPKCGRGFNRNDSMKRHYTNSCKG